MAKSRKGQAEELIEGVHAVGDATLNGGRTRMVRTMTEEEVPVEETGEISPEDNPLEALLSELGGDTAFDVAVYRIDKTKANGRSFCGPLAMGGINNSAMLCTRLQQEYGGGEFYLQFKDSEDSTFLRRIIISVDAPKAPAVPPAQVMQESVAAAIAAAMGPMQQALAQLAQMQMQRPAFNIDKLLAHPLAAPIIGGVVNKLFGNGGGATSELDKYLTMKMKMDELGVGGGEPSTLTQVGALLRDYGKPLIELAQKQAMNQSAGGPRSAPALRPMAAPGTMPVPPTGVVPGTAVPVAMPNPRPLVPAGRATSTVAPIGQLVAGLVPAIVGLAQAGVSAPDAAAQILEALPEEFVDPVCDAIESGELVKVLVQHQQLAGYSVWLQQVDRKSVV